MTKATRKRVPADKYAFLWRLMADTALSASAKCVAVALLLKFHNNKTGQCNPSFAAIGKVIGRSRRVIFPAIAELKAAGWITFQGTKGGSSTNTNRFKFNFEPVSSTALVPVSPTTPVMQNDEGVLSTAHELSRTTLPPGESVGDKLPAVRAPDGAPLIEMFERLCEIWRVKPDGINLKAAFKAFEDVCTAHDGEEVIASAAQWVASTQPRYLKKLEDWLSNGAWRKEPAQRRGKHPRGGKLNPVDEMLNAGGVKRYA